MNKELGSGFLEEVYHEALKIEFEDKKIPFESEKELNIKYKDKLIDKKYIADFLCFDKIIMEIKAVKELTAIHETQVINYLKATGLQLGLLINL